MTRVLLLAAAMPLVGRAAAHAGDAPAKTPAEVLGDAQAAHAKAEQDHEAATRAEGEAQTAHDQAKAAHDAAEGEAKAAAKTSLDEAKAKLTTAKAAAKSAKGAADKAKRAVDAADKKATIAGERDAAKQAREDARKAKAEEKAKGREEAKTAKEASKQPEQNGVRRPKAEGLCGRAWAMFDEVSKANGSPASIGETLPKATAAGINEATVRTQYARWRKFYGVTGRVKAPKPATPPATDGAGQSQPAA